ncbi:hypothetical protein BG60_35760 [Caballeronia zhejiangensis]|uniref:eCIS core domain-containing protein n=1 Tax=Caballeronia zhejiangensis TaxID=871203 RepID=A0A656QBW5_9BURK|nr:hypothetical protein BG58_41755 [Caballeronia jiangsuensis]KDR24690.1 hypothetical protein BG60_35760 [Caballeronia zhejiangensis]
MPVAQAIIAGHNAALNSGAHPIPPNIRVFLRHWYADDLLAGVRWTTSWNSVQNSLQAAQMNMNGDTRAITLINAIVFRTPADAQDYALWAHEVFHVTQYQSWGVFRFAQQWVDNSSEGGPVEAPAYARQAEAEQLWAAVNQPMPVPGVGPQPIPNLSPNQQVGTQLAGLPSNAQLAECTCAPVAIGAFWPAAQCISQRATPHPCAGMCQGGGTPWAPGCQ